MSDSKSDAGQKTTIAEAQRALEQLAKRNSPSAELYVTLAKFLETLDQRVTAVEEKHDRR
jgi:hypothetical protein